MKYYAVQFSFHCPDGQLQDARDVLSALVGEAAGFESFEETGDGLTGYVQQALFQRDALCAALECFPFGAVDFTVVEAEDRDWNEQWEQAGFEPIVVQATDGACHARTVVIHDGRHLPDVATVAPTADGSVQFIEIDARQAFGTGTHQTTRMVCRALLALDLTGLRILDCGCGTGILSICALMHGAAGATAYDIDEWSVDNTRHNAVINQVDDRLQVMHGDATLLYSMPDGVLFDVVVANINRNILLADMPAFCRVMAPDAKLVLSGFYTVDVPMLTARAAEFGLQTVSMANDGEWAMVMMEKTNA